MKTNQKYDSLKIATIYGQGMEHCGVTRTTAELSLWAEKTGSVVHVFAYTKKYSRNGAHETGDIQYFDVNTKKKNKHIKSLKETAEFINENYDIVMFMNYPNAKTDPEVYKSFYFDFYQIIQKPQKALYIHEIRGAQFNRLAYLTPMIVNADIVFHFDVTSDLSKLIDKIGLQKIGDRLHKYTLWTNFDDLNTWRQKYINKKTLGISSVTRWSSSKNVRRTIDIMDAVQKLDNWDCEIHGIERSMGAKIDVLDYVKTIYINPNGRIENEENGSVRVSGPVDRNDGVNIVASHLFSTAFWSMPKDPENYCNRMEYTQIEIIGAGTIPILDKHWGENNYTKDGKRYIDIPYSAIYTDGTDIEELSNKLIEISKDKNEIQKYLDTSYNLVVKEFGADTVIPEAIDIIMKVGKNTNQLDIAEICTKFVGETFSKEIIKLEKAGNQPILNIDVFDKGEVKYLKDSKEILVKKVKKQIDNKTKSLF